MQKRFPWRLEFDSDVGFVAKLVVPDVAFSFMSKAFLISGLLLSRKRAIFCYLLGMTKALSFEIEEGSPSNDLPQRFYALGQHSRGQQILDLDRQFAHANARCVVHR